MLFMTVIFILMAIKYFVRGQMFYDTLAKIGQMNKDKEAGKRVTNADILGELALPLMCAMVMLITHVIYLVYAYDYDPLKWPTIAMFVLKIVPTVFIKTDSKDYQVHKWTPRAMIWTMAWLAYLLYIGAVLVGVWL
jgi:hypothetical protein